VREAGGLSQKFYQVISFLFKKLGFCEMMFTSSPKKNVYLSFPFFCDTFIFRSSSLFALILDTIRTRECNAYPRLGITHLSSSIQ